MDGTVTYRVRVRLKGAPVQTASFTTRQEAVIWAKLRTAEVVAGKHFPIKTHHTLTELLERYAQDVLSRKAPRTRKREGYLLAFWRKRLGWKVLADLTKADIVRVRDEFYAHKTKASTIHRYLNILSHVLNTAVKEYDWLQDNVVARVSRPPLPRGKTRFLTDEERAKLLQECRRSKNTLLYSLVVLAMYTGLGRDSLLRLRRCDIDLEARTVSVDHTKNGTPLVLPLVGEALAVLNSHCASLTGNDYLFPHANPDMPERSYSRAFDYAMARAEIQDASFHTLRHCVGSYLAQAGIDLYMISRILNHKSLSMTARYSHLQTEHLRPAMNTLAERLAH
jgi:integrase